LFEATELSFTYPSGRRGLLNVSLSGNPGDRVVVMGPNGSGKSTLLRLVSTELRSWAGSLTLFGKESGASLPVQRKRIGIVQDTPVHVEDLTGLENALLFAELYGVGRAVAARAIETLFASLGLDEALHVLTKEYSYGMNKKLLIAEALVHDPEILILDEPALGLDPPSRAALLRILEERSGTGVCTLVATNEPSLAQELATTVVLLDEGEVVAQGSPSELLAKVGGATRIEVHVTGSATSAALAELPEDLVSIRRLPGRIVAESKTGPDALPRLVQAVLAEGFTIERIELREPDLTDVFTLFTGRTLGSKKT
jgi:ABC-type multidrug transport system ATPase subunit